MWDFPLFPEQASTIAGEVDAIYLALIGVSTFFTVGICVVLLWFAIRYRASSTIRRPRTPHRTIWIEATWIIIPFLIAMGIFFWAAISYFQIYRMPAETLDVYVVGKQWMWKVQHPSGRREINQLHVPVGQPVKLLITSQDVIHSFYIPAFRVKRDAVPGRYTTLWFEATKPGQYHLFCAEYCGADHARMIGEVIALSPENYQKWLSATPQPAGMPTAGVQAPEAGPGPFSSLGCAGCHTTDGVSAPNLAGLYGEQVRLEDGSVVEADENYLRESILSPRAKVVEGYPPIMPSYQGQLHEDQLAELIEQIKQMQPDQPDQPTGDQP